MKHPDFVDMSHAELLFYSYIQLFLASQLAGRTGDYWIGLSQDASSGVVESWNSGLPVMYTAWARSHTGMCYLLNKNTMSTISHAKIPVIH